ncbi:glycosyl transferase group 1 [Sulfuricurvum kujiense DSM 16994]|uniref:Glycosyl transferase group 1 n=1 Tax=Sulfuricurvum kujiense (strain ATCC BAA-921 / DSM 16994 / JCM 11577 / YK-1) TaxID=709032 RepID=E4U377_SULKY|nr:glycosyltransferase [Sulfuricurvum kujiense]ADR34774.1 glycosyl transferase group 1 [Sulfuricurvum kujiense DSM 16994]
MILFIDISSFLKTRLITGIQRVIREFLSRAVCDTYDLNILYYDDHTQTYKRLDKHEIKDFMQDIKNYQFRTQSEIDLFDILIIREKIFLDIDSVWNFSQKRDELYKRLKQSNYKIYNFIYDLTPLLLPDLAREITKTNFPLFIESVFEYTDFVFFDSHSARNDFFAMKQQTNHTRKIASMVIPLGSDFLIPKRLNHTTSIPLISKKYILFVGTIEPRKKQPLVLEAFEGLHARYSDLHLVFVGAIGWNVETFIHRLNLHPLKDTYVHHLTDVDDVTLDILYQNAFLVTYISSYEGYGLPVAESLQYGNITIASKNSSLIEVGQDYVDYIGHDTKEALIDIISSYLNDTVHYNQKKSDIRKNYKRHNWDNFYDTLIQTIRLRTTQNERIITAKGYDER